MIEATERIRLYVACVVVLIWSAAAVVAFFTKNFEELGIVSPVMMIVVGFLMGYKVQYIVEHEHHEQEEG